MLQYLAVHKQKNFKKFGRAFENTFGLELRQRFKCVDLNLKIVEINLWEQ